MDKQLFRNATRHKIIQAVTFLFVIFCITSTSWVVSPRWLLAGMVSAGVNLGNNSQILAWHNLRAYPASIGRLTLNYNREDWSFALTGIFNNKIVYSPSAQSFALLAPTTQFTVTRHIR